MLYTARIQQEETYTLFEQALLQDVACIGFIFISVLNPVLKTVVFFTLRILATVGSALNIKEHGLCPDDVCSDDLGF